MLSKCGPDRTATRVRLGKCTVYSAQTGNFCESDEPHEKHPDGRDKHVFTSPNGEIYTSK